MHDAWVFDKDYYAYFKVKQIRKLLYLGKFDEIVTLIHEIEMKKSFQNGVNLQFIMYAKACVMEHNNLNPDAVINYVTDALYLTFESEFDEEMIIKRFLSYNEIMLLNLLAIEYGTKKETIKAIKLLDSIKCSIERHIMDDNEKKNTYPLILQNITTYLGSNEQYEDVIKLCIEARSYCNEYGESIKFPYILFNYACALHHTNQIEESKLYFTQAYQLFNITDRLNNAAILKEFVLNKFKVQL